MITQHQSGLPAAAEPLAISLTDWLKGMVQEHRDEARGLVRRHVGFRLRRRVDCDDVLQESLAEATRLAQEGAAPVSGTPRELLSWFSTVVSNKARNLSRYHDAAKRTSRREEPLPAGGSTEPCAIDKTPSGMAMAGEEVAALCAAIDALSPREREVVTLVHLEERGVAGAATSMRKTRNATSVLLCEAVRKLREILVPRRERAR